MATSTYKRLQQAAEDHAHHVQRVVAEKFKKAGLSWQTGGYPINPDEKTAFRAGYQRACHWAYEAACRGETLRERWELNDGTAAGRGEQVGWAAAVAAMNN